MDALVLVYELREEDSRGVEFSTFWRSKQEALVGKTRSSQNLDKVPRFCFMAHFFFFEQEDHPKNTQQVVHRESTCMKVCIFVLGDCH